MLPPLLSICIPSYNRPKQLSELLGSVDARPDDVEIVVGEDCAPKQSEVRERVNAFQRASPYRVTYYENERNLGYDGNLRELIRRAGGEFVLFMGDDDLFVAGQLNPFLDFVRANRDVSYFLRSYYGRPPAGHSDGTLEQFKYLPSARRLPPGIETCVFLFKRTVSIAGVTFKRSRALDFSTNRFDGTLLYQLYLVAEIALTDPTMYCDIPVAIAIQSYRLDNPQFGTASAEKSSFTPGTVTAANSVNFTKGYFTISRYVDTKYGIDTTTLIQRDLSKFSYPFLSIQRKRGRREFPSYVRLLARETGIARTWHYYFYSAALWLFGERFCDAAIQRLKKLIGHTPRL